jgi:hypothetical protein
MKDAVFQKQKLIQCDPVFQEKFMQSSEMFQKHELIEWCWLSETSK